MTRRITISKLVFLPAAILAVYFYSRPQGLFSLTNHILKLLVEGCDSDVRVALFALSSSRELSCFYV